MLNDKFDLNQCAIVVNQVLGDTEILREVYCTTENICASDGDVVGGTVKLNSLWTQCKIPAAEAVAMSHRDLSSSFLQPMAISIGKGLSNNVQEAAAESNMVTLPALNSQNVTLVTRPPVLADTNLMARRMARRTIVKFHQRGFCFRLTMYLEDGDLVITLQMLSGVAIH